MTLKVDKNLNKPMYLQIYDNIVDEIKNGYLIPFERLSPRRKLSAEIGVSTQTVDSAYQKLIVDGYIVSKQGSGYYVSSERVWDKEQQEMKKRVYNFSTNGIETSKLPFQIWSKLLRLTIKEDTGLFQHGEKAGEWCLRKSIRRLLFRTQNIKCKTEQIIIGPGYEDLLREICVLFGRNNKIIMNNYYNYRAREAALQASADIEYVTNDENGIRIEEIDDFDRGFLYQEPTHDLPMAATLSEEKRKVLAEWAKKGEGRYIIEDASDNDFQYGKNEKTIWELSGGKNIIYLGNFSMTIAPSMKIGYIVAPDDFVKWWFDRKKWYSNRVSRIEQVTLSKFIDLGYYEKHIKYMRDIYKEKTRVVKEAVYNSPLAAKTKITGDTAGTYCNMFFDISITEKRARELCVKNGIKISALTSCVEDKTRAIIPENTYNIGYGDLTNSQIRDGFHLLAEIWKKYL